MEKTLCLLRLPEVGKDSNVELGGVVRQLRGGPPVKTGVALNGDGTIRTYLLQSLFITTSRTNNYDLGSTLK